MVGSDMKSFVQDIIKGKTRKADILKALKKAGIFYEDASAESGYMNIRIRTGDGMVRIYQNKRKEIIVQVNRLVEFKYSGIPVFFGIKGRME